MSFGDEISRYDWDEMAALIAGRELKDVESALSAGHLDVDKVASLLSPAADQYLEEIAGRAQVLTEQRFGRVIGLYAPLYLSNSCSNSCAYCSFSADNKIERITLSPEQMEEDGRYLNEQGFRHILLVSGEDRKAVSMEYLQDVVGRLRPLFDSISIEIYPMETDQYCTLARCGVDGLIIYQETYNPSRYDDVHGGGQKKDFRWRLTTPERGGEAGFRRLGIGALLGLADWRVEALFIALHTRYLMKKYWRSQITISFPRLRPAVGGYTPPCPVSDRDLVHMMTVLRLFLPDAGLLLSTRESAHLRDHMIPLGVTAMSAGSKTEPGGYTQDLESAGQFEISDHRSPGQIAEMIRLQGYEPVWKDWDEAFIPRVNARKMD